MNCIIHKLAYGEDRPAIGVMEGYTLCLDCATAVLNLDSWIYRRVDDTPALAATINALKAEGKGR